MPERLPDAFAHLADASKTVAERAWSGLGHFFLCQSILALAWTQIYSASSPPSLTRQCVLVAISLVGVAMGFQWAPLVTRMWHYHLEYSDRVRALYRSFTEKDHGPGATAWREVDDVIDAYWRANPNYGSLRALSGNQWILFLAPLFLSLLHLVMLAAVLWDSLAYGPYVAIVVCVAVLIGFALVWKICEPVIKRPVTR